MTRATKQYLELAANKEATAYTVRLLDMMLHWWGLSHFTYNTVEDYYYKVYRKIDCRYSLRTVERKIRELAENGYLLREKQGRTYRFVPTPAFHALAAQLNPTHVNYRPKRSKVVGGGSNT